MNPFGDNPMFQGPAVEGLREDMRIVWNRLADPRDEVSILKRKNQQLLKLVDLLETCLFFNVAHYEENYHKKYKAMREAMGVEQ